ncbi:hypothetical protein CO038_01490 [Candidatus Pacearchaeota archaeon CG_4_9_14_0_2_um_filter_39_13]|nr:hypothetical protein [Candidatus Pacearchaeota archaeon]OIO43787.1 MAG: hypothetical protein AUJ64_01745 [Candidatus Pacearchaeota archaeon CG1_02_39_14]PJC44882.1 MAG: hypothetical protein CO038_01490 [Candidatus Pacearchaeota archaeon CG_4_9_14_0_2_um_filter_39_13]
MRKKSKKGEPAKKKKRIISPSAVRFNPKNEKDIAMDFAVGVHKKFADLIKASILFGSQAKNQQGPGSDIDIILIIDDATIDWDMELIAWYREELGKIISANKNSVNLHINTIKLTSWWKDLMHGDPVVINILRYGEALIDIGGFFNPQKALLLSGRIHSTPEAIYESLQRAPQHLARSKMAEMGAIEGVFWAMVDSSQAALMTLGLLPPSPEHISSMLKESFVDSGLLNVEYIKWFRDIRSLYKEIEHGNVRDIKGADIDLWQERAQKFISKMAEVIDKTLESRRGK